MKKFSNEWCDARSYLKKQALVANKAATIAALKLVGISHAFVEYSGSGDSGSATEIYCTQDGSQIETPSVHVVLEFLNYESEPALLQKNVLLSEALNNLCEEAISLAGHDGYENNSGGGGTMTIDLERGSLVLEHYDIIEDRDESSHEF